MNFVKTLLISNVFCIPVINPSFAFQGPGPDRLWVVMNSYVQFDKIGVKKSIIGIQTYGDRTKLIVKQKTGGHYDKYFNDKINIAAVVI